MNHIPAVITDIKRVDSINLVSFEVEGEQLRMISLELPSTLCIGSKVVLGAKASHIAIAKELNNEISISNQLRVVIESIQHGELLCSIKFSVAGSLLESIITKESALRMGLKEGKSIVALIKSSELSIVEVL